MGTQLIDTERFKKNFKLIAQIEGSAGSIMDTIAEGFEKGGNLPSSYMLRNANAEN